MSQAVSPLGQYHVEMVALLYDVPNGVPSGTVLHEGGRIVVRCPKRFPFWDIIITRRWSHCCTTSKTVSILRHYDHTEMVALLHDVQNGFHSGTLSPHGDGRIVARCPKRFPLCTMSKTVSILGHYDHTELVALLHDVQNGFHSNDVQNGFHSGTL